MKYFYAGVLLAGMITVVIAGCGGGGSGPTPQPTTAPTATPRPTATPAPTATPGPTPTPAPPPGVVFDLRGRVLVGGTPTAGVTVQAVGDAGAATASEQTTSGAGGVYSFFLGGGTYTITARSGALQSSRRVTIPPGGQAVDMFDLNL